MLSELTKLKESVDKIKDILNNEVLQITQDILSNSESMSNEYTEEENKLVDYIEETIVDIQKGLDEIYTYDDWNELKDIEDDN
jgi:Na+/phosphate symporter